jgi:hypothetical protein
VNLARKFPFHEKQPYPLDRRRTRKRRNAPPKRPPTLHAGGAALFLGPLAVGVTRRYTLRYTLSYRLKLHLLPRMRAPLWRFRQVAERLAGRTLLSIATHSQQVSLPATGNEEGRRDKIAGSYLAGYRDSFHRGVLAAVTGQERIMAR